MKPEEADFGITVDFKKGVSDPIRVFEGISVLLDGFRQLDRLTINALDLHIEPIMVLEDVEANTITAWVRNRLRQTDDQAIKDFDWRKQVGAFAIKAKYRVLEYLDQREEANERVRLLQLRDDLTKLANEPQFRHLPLPTSIPLNELVVPLDRIQEAKGLFSRADKLIVKTDDRSYEVDISVTKKPSEYAEEPIAEETSGKMRMKLLVRKPDYLGDSLWEFRHGKQSIEAHILDSEWLGRFRAGQVVITPGNALDCLVEYTYRYDEKGEMVSGGHDVVKVYDVLGQRHHQGVLPGS